MLDIQWKRRRMSGFVIKHCLTEASPRWKCFGKYNKDREFYTFNDKHVRDFIRQSIKGGRVVVLNRCFESNQCEEVLTKFKKINDNEISNIVGENLKYNNIKSDEFKLEFENGEKNYRKKLKRN